MIRLAPAVAQDEATIFAWRNTPEAYAYGMTRRPVTTDEHARWWREHVMSPDCNLWIISRPIGFVRIDHAGTEHAVSIYLEPEHRERGIAGRALDEALAEWPHPVTAIVRRDNPTAQRFFGNHRFVPVEMMPETIRFVRQP